METQDQKNKCSADKTIILSMIPGATKAILPFAREKNVGYDCLGKDQNENDLVKFTYSIEQKETINSINVYVKFFAACMAGFNPLIEPLLKVMQDEADKLNKELKTDNFEKRKFPRSKSELKNKADGNETGKHAA